MVFLSPPIAEGPAHPPSMANVIQMPILVMFFMVFAFRLYDAGWF
jgi:hypothetical protein